MKIRCKNTIDDLIAVGPHHSAEGDYREFVAALRAEFEKARG